MEHQTRRETKVAPGWRRGLQTGESMFSYEFHPAKLKAVSSQGEIILDAQILLNTLGRRHFAYYSSDGSLSAERKTYYHTEKPH